MEDGTEKAYTEVRALCNGKKWQMSIPVNEANDSDCIIINGLASARLNGVRAGYLLAAKDMEENTVKMIAEGVKRGYSEGYLKALDDVMKKIISHDNQYSSGCWNDAAHMVIDMKSDYLRQEGKNGKQN